MSFVIDDFRVFFFLVLMIRIWLLLMFAVVFNLSKDREGLTVIKTGCWMYFIARAIMEKNSKNKGIS